MSCWPVSVTGWEAPRSQQLEKVELHASEALQMEPQNRQLGAGETGENHWGETEIRRRHWMFHKKHTQGDGPMGWDCVSVWSNIFQWNVSVVLSCWLLRSADLHGCWMMLMMCFFVKWITVIPWMIGNTSFVILWDIIDGQAPVQVTNECPVHDKYTILLLLCIYVYYFLPLQHVFFQNFRQVYGDPLVMFLLS